MSRRRRHADDSQDDVIVNQRRKRDAVVRAGASPQISAGMAVQTMRYARTAPNSIERLQATFGNQAVQRMIMRQRLPNAAVEPVTDQSTQNTQGRELWERATTAYTAGRYQRAIILFERIRNLPGMSEQVIAAMTFNIGVANLRLHRYNTAIIYFEEYLRIGDDRELGQARLDEARRGAGLPAQREETEGGAGGANVSSGAGGESAAGLQVLRDTFYSALADYRGGNYGRAIAKFERIRSARGASEEVRQAVVYNIGMCMLRMRRYATAVFYFEQYLNMGGSDRERGEQRLDEAKRGAGIPVEDESEDVTP
ncbi:MAG TPA: tetratricopeptide repeat protein [Anaerolineaceae bacterium]